jgi:hypothetical protein
MFNDHPRIEHVRFPNGGACLVVDDALREPDRLVDFASSSRADFRSVDFNAYPGIFLLAPAALEQAQCDFFNRHLRRFFDARRVLSSHCRLSMVTLSSDALKPRQWLCHRDGVGAEATQSIQASVLYLFADATLGGTSFYEPARPPEEIARLFHDASTLPEAQFVQKYSIARGYMNASNIYFNKVGSIAAQWNRLIFYDGSQLHSGDIPAPERLSDDPRTGRLTLNGFFTSRRRAA